MNREPDEGPLRCKYARMAEIGQSMPRVYETSLGKRVIFRTFDAHAKAGRVNLNSYL